MLAALDKLKSTHAYLDPISSFLKSCECNLRTNDLVYFGARQAKFTRKETVLRYPYLDSPEHPTTFTKPKIILDESKIDTGQQTPHRRFRRLCHRLLDQPIRLSDLHPSQLNTRSNPLREPPQ
ncbi:hypothetical protein F5887DRAFT_1086387 [Amanita rubescens]|nr:hypothetical protein F5887DRAFT_1086387 [Amanita rubescens]